VSIDRESEAMLELSLRGVLKVATKETGAAIGFAAPVVIDNRQSTMVGYLRFRQT
jgi:hypothetical protein